MIRARVTGVEGQRLNLDGIEDVRGRGSLAREYTVTFRPGLEANERIVEGAFWPAAPSEDLEVSIEASLRERFGFEARTAFEEGLRKSIHSYDISVAGHED